MQILKFSSEQFRRLYWIGICAASVVSFLPISLIAYWGIIHLSAMIYVGANLPRLETGIAGKKICHTGVFYALAGLANILLWLAAKSGPSAVTVPLALGVLSAAVAWFAGSEISTQAGTDHEAAETRRVVEQVRMAVEAMQKVSSEFVISCETANQATQRLFAHHLHSSELMAASVTKCDQAAKSIDLAFTGLNERLGVIDAAFHRHLGDQFVKTVGGVAEATALLSEQLTNAAHGAESTARYLADSQLLIDELARLINTVTQVREQQSSMIQQLTASVRTAVEPLTYQIQMLTRQLQGETTLSEMEK